MVLYVYWRGARAATVTQNGLEILTMQISRDARSDIELHKSEGNCFDCTAEKRFRA